MAQNPENLLKCLSVLLKVQMCEKHLVKMTNSIFLISDSIPGVGGGKSEEDEVSKEDQVTVIIQGENKL